MKMKYNSRGGIGMNCWKSINITKEFGLNRLYMISFLLGLLSFIFLYVPFSILHGDIRVNESGIIPLVIGLLFLPTIHTFMHILPLIIMNKRVKLKLKKSKKLLCLFTYYTKAHITKKATFVTLLTPSVFITLPGVIASYIFADYYVYWLIFAAVHIGISFSDFLSVLYIAKAPKAAFIENVNNGFDILIKAAK